MDLCRATVPLVKCQTFLKCGGGHGGLREVGEESVGRGIPNMAGTVEI